MWAHPLGMPVCVLVRFLLYVYVWCVLLTPGHCEGVYMWDVYACGVCLECGIHKSVCPCQGWWPVCVFVV